MSKNPRSISPTICDDTEPRQQTRNTVPRMFIFGAEAKVELKSRFRSALSPWIDLRNQADLLRDRLEEGAIDLSQISQPVSGRELD